MPWRKLLASFLACVLAFVAAEIAHRLWLGARGQPYSRASVLEEIANLRDLAGNFALDQGEPAPGAESDAEVEAEAESGAEGEAGYERYSGRNVLHPFHAFDRPEGAQQVAIDLELARRHPDELRILIVGGSVAAIFGRHGAARLEARLSEDPRLAGRRVRFLRYGRAASKQPQQLMLIADLVGLGMAPEIVLEIDGYNELAIGFDNFERGTHPTFPARDRWLTLVSGGASDPEALELAHELLVRREELLRRATSAERSPLLASSILGRGVLGGLRRLQATIAEDQASFVGRLGRGDVPQHHLGPPFQGDARAALELIAEHWRESSYSAHLLCAGRGIAYLHVLQPTLLDRGSKPLLDEERALERTESWTLGVVQGYPMLRERGAELRARGVHFLDASGLFAQVEERIYRDNCHYNEHGNQLLADAIAKALLEFLPADGQR